MEINKHNGDRHIFQPRIEPNWNKLTWYTEQIQHHPSGRDRHNPCDALHIKESNCVKAIKRINTSTVNYQNWLEEPNDAIKFMMDEYYLALGQESVTGKFFHLFSIIEFIEHEYKDHVGARLLFREEERKTLIDALETQIHNCIDDKDKLKRLQNKINQYMTETTDIGRTLKLKNILTWLGLDVPITDEFLCEITNLRNKSFHGTRASDEEI